MKTYTEQETATFKANRRHQTLNDRARTGKRIELQYPDNATAAQRGFTEVGSIAKRLGIELAGSVKKTMKNIEDGKAAILRAKFYNRQFRRI